MNFKSAVDFLIHPKLKTDKTAHEKARVYAIIFLIIFCFNLSYVIFFWSNGQFLGTKSVHNYLAVCLGLFCLISTKFYGNVEKPLWAGTLLGYYLISISIYLSGGIYSQDFVWLTVITTAGFVFINIRAGIFLAILSVLCVSIFYFLDFGFNVKFESEKVASSVGYKYFNYLLSLIVLALMVYVLVKSNIKLQKIIQLKKEQELREDIARDFHDQIGNKLASIRHITELLKLQSNLAEHQNMFSKIDANAKDVYDNFREFIWTLDSKSNFVEELYMYIRDFMEDYLKFSNIIFYSSSDPWQLPELLLPIDASKEIAPLFKEAITNVYRHAKAKNVYFDLQITNQLLTITLKDDGLGIGRQASKGMGLKNMAFRAEKSGGTLEIISNIESGTTLKYVLQIPKINTHLN